MTMEEYGRGTELYNHKKQHPTKKKKLHKRHIKIIRNSFDILFCFTFVSVDI